MRFIVIDMPKNEVRIYNSKAVIYQNDYDVWQFRIWLADEDKYFRQSLRTKDKAKAIADAEEMYTASIWLENSFWSFLVTIHTYNH